jgi:hypothetical protein
MIKMVIKYWESALIHSQIQSPKKSNRNMIISLTNDSKRRDILNDILYAFLLLLKFMFIH